MAADSGSAWPALSIEDANRKLAEPGTPLGGPAMAISPAGDVVAESDASLVLVDVDPGLVAAARSIYPAYLAIPSTIYAQGWSRIADQPARPIPD